MEIGVQNTENAFFNKKHPISTKKSEQKMVKKAKNLQVFDAQNLQVFFTLPELTHENRKK